MIRKNSKKIAGLSALLSAGLVAAAALGMAPAAGAATVAASTPAWSWVGTIQQGDASEFTAVVATGKTSGFAFQAVFGQRPAAYERTRATTWARVPFPGVPRETVITAGASSSSNVWAFGLLPDGNSQAVKLVNGRWDAVKTLPGSVSRASVLAPNDVWVFGQLGAYHFNGSTWTREASIAGDADGRPGGGEAVSPTDFWTYSGTTVTHHSAGRQTTVNLASLLPAKFKNNTNDPAIDGIFVLSDQNVYAIGSGNAQDAGGPTVILHDNGHRWTRVITGGTATSGQASSDGNGGFFMPACGEGVGCIMHYSDGKVTQTLFTNGGEPQYINATSQVPGSTENLAVSNTRAADGRPEFYGIILQYS
jgi:hypothetical protein